MAFFSRVTRNSLRPGAANALRRSLNTQASSKSSVAPLMYAGTLAGASAVAGWYLAQKKTSPLQFNIIPQLMASPPPPEDLPNKERTFIMIKPDGVARGLVADIIKRFEQRGYKLVAMKMMTPSLELLNEHYGDLKGKPFFNGLVKHISSGPVVAMVWEGKKAVTQGRAMLGETNPLSSKPGSIRGDYSIDMGRNIIHGSDSVETAKAEIGLWFNESELQDWTLPTESSIYE